MANMVERKRFEGSYQQIRNDITMEISHLFAPHHGEVVKNADSLDTVDADVDNVDNDVEVEAVEAVEEEELEVNGYCNLCSKNWTEDEESYLNFLFFPCGHSYHFKCFGNYILENTKGIKLEWEENTAQRCVIDLVINKDLIPLAGSKCIICEYFEEHFKDREAVMRYTPDAKLKAIYQNNQYYNTILQKYINESESRIYYREQDIDELEKYFQLGDIICFQEAPQELYILDLNMLKKPCFKKCVQNIIPYKFVQMFGYHYYINSIYSTLINILPLDTEEKEYWDLENRRIVRREYLDYEEESIPELKEIEEDEELGSLQLRDDHLCILDEDKQWIQLSDTKPIIPFIYTRSKGYEYYIDWYMIYQYPIQLSVSTFEVLDVENRDICGISMKMQNIRNDDDDDNDDDN
jgi:hypothetical protein